MMRKICMNTTKTIQFANLYKKIFVRLNISCAVSENLTGGF